MPVWLALPMRLQRENNTNDGSQVHQVWCGDNGCGFVLHACIKGCLLGI